MDLHLDTKNTLTNWTSPSTQWLTNKCPILSKVMYESSYWLIVEYFIITWNVKSSCCETKNCYSNHKRQGCLNSLFLIYFKYINITSKLIIYVSKKPH
jgi:hypothetical protein